MEKKNELNFEVVLVGAASELTQGTKHYAELGRGGRMRPGNLLGYKWKKAHTNIDYP